MGSTNGTAMTAEKRSMLMMAREVANVVQRLKVCQTGTAYAAVMDLLSLDEFNRLVSLMVLSGIVEREGETILKWTGKPL